MIDSPQQFGKYRLLEKIAVGGMAEIFRAKARGLGGFEKVLAIKRLHRHFEEGDEFAQMLIDEAKIAVHLTHPNIAQIFDLGRIENRYFIAMEYIEGTDMHRAERSLRERGQHIPIPVALFTIAESLAGLHYAHTRCDSNGRPMEIVHRDVSPQNIMISHTGEVKVVDFGIAKAEKRLQEETQQGIIKGKFYYMAPEQAYGHHVDARTDIFAAGMCLYEMLAGSNPYEGMSDHELLHAVRQAQIEPLSQKRREIDQQLERIVMTAIRRDPNYRFKTAREFQRTLSDYISQRFGNFRRLDLAEFVDSLPAAAFGNTAGPDEITDRLSREEFEASEESVIFEPGSPFDDPRDDRFDPGPDSDINPFADEENTELWMPGERPTRGDDPFDDAPTPPPDENQFGGPPEPEPQPQFRNNRAEPVHLGEPSSGASQKQSTNSVDVGWLDDLPIKKRYVVAAAALLTVLLSVGVGLAIFGDDGEPDDEKANAIPIEKSTPDKSGAPAQKSPEFVDMDVETSPAGATVLLEGVEQGTTPMTLTDLIPDESYRVTFEKEGYRKISREITVSESSKPLEVKLRSSGGDGILKVTTFPTNATVFLDGEEVGKSPVTVDGLEREGEYEVSAKLDGREDVEETLEWSEGKRVERLSLEFEMGDDDEEASERERVRRRPRRRPRRASSRSSSRSSNDDEKEEGGSLDLWGDGESSDDSSGSTASKSSDNDSSGKSGKLNIWGEEKTQEKAQGYLSVQVQRGWGKVFVNGRLVAKETPLVKHPVDSGTHRVKVYFPTLKRYSKVRRVSVRPGQTSTEIFTP